MFTVFKDFKFSAAHQVRGHTGGCQNLHGHNYRVRLFLSATELNELGMVIDFSDLKALVNDVAGHFDHQLINDHPPFDRINPTAELLAQFVYRECRNKLAERHGSRVSVEKVEVWENDTSCATYREP
ncbi:MAG: 6-carboxytetrahydropterin synthase QueD [Acidobacteriota bacterium]